jgi:hypothetical protein
VVHDFRTGRRGFAASFLRNRGSGLGASILPRIGRSRLGARLCGYLGQYCIRYHYLDYVADEAQLCLVVTAHRLII